MARSGSRCGVSAPTVFNYREHEVRTAVVDGEPWFVLADLCRVLGIANVSNVAARLDDDERKTVRLAEGIQRGNPNVTVVNEPGMYQVVLRSDKPEARQFRWWITHEVIPAIRKHGVYATPAAAEAMLADPDLLIQALTALKAERAARADAEAANTSNAPKVLFANAVTASDTTILVGDLAKILRGNGVSIGANRLFARLRDEGYLIRRQGTDWNMPTQRAMELGLFRVKETAATHADGHTTITKTPKVTGKGQAYFVDRYLRALGAVVS